MDDVAGDHSLAGIPAGPVIEDRPNRGPSPQPRATLVDHDAIEPGVHPLRIAQVPPVQPRLDRGVVYRILGFHAVSEDDAGEAVGAFETALREPFKGHPTLGLDPHRMPRQNRVFHSLLRHHAYQMPDDVRRFKYRSVHQQ